MADGSDELERSSREQLILKARVLGVERAELMTRVELRDEIVRRSEPDLVQQKRARGFLGVARDLVASVVEAGLNLPDAAAIIRGEGSREGEWKGPPPVATVTLAEIYAAQGHLDRALRMLDEVLAKEPDHDPARALRDRLAAGTDLPSPAPRRRTKIAWVETPEPASEPEVEPESQPVVEAAPTSEPVTVPEPFVEPAAELQPVTVADPVVEVAPESVVEAAPETVVEVAPESVVEAAPETVVEAAPETVVEAAPESVAEIAAAPEHVAAPVSAVVAPCVITLSVAGLRQVYWEVPLRTWDALRARAPHGRALLRVVSFRTRAGKVERRAHDFSPNAEVGSATLPGLTTSSVVRAVLGWEADGRFQPFVVASDLASSAVTSSAAKSGRFVAHPLVGAVTPNIEARAVSYLARRPG